MHVGYKLSRLGFVNENARLISKKSLVYVVWFGT